MNQAEDRVLVAAITRRKDLGLAREAHWYRIPLARMPLGVTAEYLAFFTVARVAGKERSGIYWYARLTGVELLRRRDLLPEESQRADELYYRLQLDGLQTCARPILNPEGRAFAFIHSTWDRFSQARRISDLTSRAPGFVMRDSPLQRTVRQQDDMLRCAAPASMPWQRARWRLPAQPLLDNDCQLLSGQAH